MENWYAIFTQPKAEFAAAAKMRSRYGVQTALPFIRVRKRRRRPGTDRFLVEQVDVALLPSYLFCRAGDAHVQHIEDTPGVVSIVRRPLSRIIQIIPEKIIDGLMALTDATGLVMTEDRTKPAEFKGKIGDSFKWGEFTAEIVSLDKLPVGIVIAETAEVIFGKKIRVEVPVGAVEIVA